MSEYIKAMHDETIKADKYRSMLIEDGMNPIIAEDLVHLSKRGHYNLLAKEVVSVEPINKNLRIYTQPSNIGKSLIQLDIPMAMGQSRLSQEDAALLLQSRFPRG